MSIFIAMPTTQDTEFLPTIQDAIEKADDPKGLYFGIRMMTSNESDKDYFNKLQMQYGRQIRGYVDIITSNNRLEKIGTGKARKAVSEMYMGEDYILSIDSHTLFCEGWDTKLIDLLNRAKKETNNKKTILTGYPAKYYYKDNERVFHNESIFYPFMGWEEEWDLDTFPFLSRPLWEVCLPWMIKTIDNPKEFLPSPKFAYNFSFSDEMFLYDEDEELIIMEEDIVKTWKLYLDGWELVFPNVDYPIIGHMYITEIERGNGERANWDDFVSPEEAIELRYKEVENFERYYNDPNLRGIITYYENWIDADFLDKSLHNYKIPDTWYQEG